MNYNISFTFNSLILLYCNHVIYTKKFFLKKKKLNKKKINNYIYR